MIKAFINSLIVEPIKDTEKTAGGVYRPEASKDKPQKGVIVDISPIMLIEHDFVRSNDNTTLTSEFQKLKKGMTVYYKRWGNEEVKEDKEYVFLRFSDILGVEE